jgi:hypothetical protein
VGKCVCEWANGNGSDDDSLMELSINHHSDIEEYDFVRQK